MDAKDKHTVPYTSNTHMLHDTVMVLHTENYRLRQRVRELEEALNIKQKELDNAIHP